MRELALVDRPFRQVVRVHSNRHRQSFKHAIGFSSSPKTSSHDRAETSINPLMPDILQGAALIGRFEFPDRQTCDSLIPRSAPREGTDQSLSE